MRSLLVAIVATSLLLVGGASASAAVTPDAASKWMQGYLKAWQTRDADAVVKLFTPNAVYQSVPGDKTQTFTGRAAIHKYWVDVTKTQSRIRGIQGKPIVHGNRAAIEIWVRFRDASLNPKSDHMITLLETNVLTFAANGLVSKNVEYWNARTGSHAPPVGWGK